VHDHLIRIAGRLDTIRDTIATAIQVNLSMVSIDESEVNKKLAAWAAIFAVFTAFAGIWGMNFKFEWGYPCPSYLYKRFRNGSMAASDKLFGLCICYEMLLFVSNFTV
jgi:magnesium transporter